MTLHQAMLNAERSGLRISNPLLYQGELLSLEQLKRDTIPALIAIDNGWELEARELKINEHSAKERLVPVLRRYISGTKVDELADQIINEFFLEHAT